MTYTFEIEPTQVLRVPPNATLEQIRDAYRMQSKRYHPDLGGDEWAFRLVARSYEVLSRARIAGRIAAESAQESRPVAPRVDPVSRPQSDSEGASVRSGVRDRVEHPLLLVDIELLLLRLELENPYVAIGLSPAERNLSCSLNVTWPSTLAAEADSGADRSPVLVRVADAFSFALRQTKPSSAAQDEGARSFQGWLSYPTAQLCYSAFNVLRKSLRERGLGVNQRIREMVIPRS